MESDAVKRHDYALQSDLWELRFRWKERVHVIRDERKSLNYLNREKVQENLESIPEIDFRTAVVLQAELWDMYFPTRIR